MASSGIDAGSATSPHAPDEIADLSLVQSIPFFLKEVDKAFTVQRVAPVHSSSQNVPHVFNRENMVATAIHPRHSHPGIPLYGEQRGDMHCPAERMRCADGHSCRE